MIQSKNFLNNRQKRLNGISKNCYLKKNYDFLKIIKIEKIDFENLKYATNLFLWENLISSFSNSKISLNENIFSRYLDKIVKLPNRTPNGMIRIYKENFKSYNIIHNILKQILKKNKLDEKFSHIQKTFKIRCVTNKFFNKTKKRPYSTNKIHTDIWVGEPISALLFNIPIFNFDDIGINFFQPNKNIFNHLNKIPDYNIAKPYTETLKKYSINLNKEFMFLSDPIVCHQTQTNFKKKLVGRLSIDFRAIPKKLFNYEKKVQKKFINRFFCKISDWNDYSETKIIANPLGINSFHNNKNRKVNKLGIKYIKDNE